VEKPSLRLVHAHVHAGAGAGACACAGNDGTMLSRFGRTETLVCVRACACVYVQSYDPIQIESSRVKSGTAIPAAIGSTPPAPAPAPADPSGLCSPPHARDSGLIPQPRLAPEPAGLNTWGDGNVMRIWQHDTDMRTFMYVL